MIKVKLIATPLGEMVAAANEEGICLLDFTDGTRHSRELKDIEKFLKSGSEAGVNDFLTKLELQLNEYFLGTRKEFELSLLMTGTSFQKRVWTGLMSIKYGKTRSYREQAEELDCLNSVRAVANANGMNRIAIVIPCHRVIGSDGSLTGYGGGLERKRWLLSHEKKYSGQPFEKTLF